MEVDYGHGVYAEIDDVTSYTTSFFEDDVRDVMWFDNTMTCEDEKAVVVAETLEHNKTLLLMWTDKGGKGNRD